MKTRASLGAAALLVALGAGCHRADEPLAARSGAPAAVPPSSSAAASVPVSQPVLDSRSRGFEAGSGYVYALELRVRVGFGELASHFDFDLTGDVELTPVEVSEQRASLRLAVRDVSLTDRVPASHGEVERLRADLRNGEAFFTLAGGLLRELAFPHGQSAIASNTYRQIAAALQHAVPREPQARYQAEEHDTTGRYVAEYVVQAGARRFSKTKLRYLALLGSGKLAPELEGALLPQLHDSRGTVELSEEGRPLLVQLSEEARLASSQAPVLSALSLTLRATRTEPATFDPARLAARRAQARHLDASQALPPEITSQALDAARIGDLDFPTVLRRLEALSRNAVPAPELEDDVARFQEPEVEAARAADVRERSTLFAALRGLFRQKPEHVSEALRRVRSQSPAAEALIDALAASDSEPAQRGLVSLIESPATTPSLQSRAITALTRTPHPTRHAVAALRAILERQPFNRRALYGLGSFALHYRDQGKAEAAAQLGELLLAHLKRAPSESDTVSVLRAVANSGYEPALPQVRPYLTDRRSTVRAAALRALQFMNVEAADSLIAERLSSDDSSEVRIAALESAELRPATRGLATAVEVAAEMGSDPHVRYRAVRLMARWLADFPELRARLERIARADGEERIRELASAAL